MSALLSPVVIATLADNCSCLSKDSKVFKVLIKEAATPPITEVLRKLRRSIVFMILVF
jgi:hypothetical protein